MDAHQHNTGISRVAEAGGLDDVPIRLNRMDSVIGASEHVDLIKINVEWHEPRVLQGSEAVIRRDAPYILFEQHRKDFIDGTSRSIEILKGVGYRSFAMIRPYPGKHLLLPRAIRRVFQSLVRVLLGERREIAIVDRFRPDFYSFVVTIHDWALARLDPAVVAGSSRAERDHSR